MKLPKEYPALVGFARELIDQCMYSRDRRRMLYQELRALFYMGSSDGMPSKYNRCYTHVDKLSSYIFSAAGVRVTVEFEGDALPAWAEKTKSSSRYMNRNAKSRNLGVAFASANQTSLVEGAAIAKLTWKNGGWRGWPIRPAFFGVLEENKNSLDDQEAFVHSFYVTPAGFARLVGQNPDREELIKRAEWISAPQNESDLLGDSYFHEIIAGGISPIGYSGNAANSSTGAVSVVAPMMPMLAPDVATKLIRVDELWVWNDTLDDWTTIRYVEPGMIFEGRYQHRNLSDIPREHNFVKVCSNEVEGSFWGRSEMAALAEAQRQLTRRTDDIDRIWNLRSQPPRAFVGFQGVTDDKALALLTPGAYLAESAIGGKVENLAPEMPPEALAWLEKLEQIFDDVGGFTNILSGEGEPGVRAGVHAGTLLRTSTPRLRERALLTELQYGAFMTKALRMAQAKDAKLMLPRGDAEQAFLLKNLPADAVVTVDSHSSSPAFVEDERQVAMTLAKAEAIDGETLIEMMQPPRAELLIERLRQRQEAQAKFAAENPMVAAEQAKRKR